MSFSIPKGWEEIRLGKIAREISVRNRESSNIPVLSVTKHNGFVLSSDYFSKSVHSEDTSNYKVVDKGQFAYATIHLDEGSIALLKEFDQGIISPMYTVFEVNADLVCRDYLFRCLKRFALSGRFDPYSNGGVNRRKSISFRDLQAFKIALPPLAEQRAIAETLDAFEKSIAATEKLINAIAQSRVEITRSFLGDEDKPKWPLQSVGSLIQKCQYGLSIPLDGEGTVPVLRMPDINAGRVNVDISRLKSTHVTSAEISSCSIRNGDILFNRTNSHALVGKTGIVRNEPPAYIVFASYLIRMIVKYNVNPFWLNAALNLPRTQERLKAIATPGVSQWNINSKTLKRLMIATPPKPDQDSFAELYEAIEARIEAERRKLDALYDVRVAVAQELLAGRHRLPESVVERYRDRPERAA